jgi:rhodanese-related sulfurtransferase
MDPKQAWASVQEGKAVLVDVREEEELRESGLAEGALWMPTSKMHEDDEEWARFKRDLPRDKEVILYCRSGQRSGRVAEFLAQDGFRTSNAGGFKDWKAAGLPVKNFP